MPLINVKVIEGVFTPEQKTQIAERLTDALISVEGENMRGFTWCVIDEVNSGDWAIGGKSLTTDRPLPRVNKRAPTRRRDGRTGTGRNRGSYRCNGLAHAPLVADHKPPASNEEAPCRASTSTASHWNTR